MMDESREATARASLRDCSFSSLSPAQQRRNAQMLELTDLQRKVETERTARRAAQRAVAALTERVGQVEQLLLESARERKRAVDAYEKEVHLRACEAEAAKTQHAKLAAALKAAESKLARDKLDREARARIEARRLYDELRANLADQMMSASAVAAHLRIECDRLKAENAVLLSECDRLRMIHLPKAALLSSPSGSPAGAVSSPAPVPTLHSSPAGPRPPPPVTESF